MHEIIMAVLFKLAANLSLLNKKVYIKSKNNFHDGGWGIVVLEIPEDDEYHVAMYNDKNNICVFSKKELKIGK